MTNTLTTDHEAGQHDLLPVPGCPGCKPRPGAAPVACLDEFAPVAYVDGCPCQACHMGRTESRS